jgi:hypothetical protein
MWWYVCNVRYTLFMHNRTHKLRANETTPASPQNASFDLKQLLDAPIECLHCRQRARAAAYAILISAISTLRSKGEGRREKGEGRKAQLVIMYLFDLLFVYSSEGGVVRSYRVF